MTVLVASVALAVILALRWLARRAALFVIGLASDVPPKLADSRAWARLRAVRSRLTDSHPAFVAFAARRVEPHRPTGLLLTLLVLAGLYLSALLSGLAEDILEAQGTVHSDNLINAALDPWRTGPLVAAFRWITDLGSTPAIVAAVIIATGFLWPQRRPYFIVSLWVTCLGAVTTTTIGKLLIARHRPAILLDPGVTGWSFPSGHATAAMAVYGFIAYAIARTLPGFRERFEVTYWTVLLIMLIGFSRIFLSVHYLTDVLGGFMVGGFWLLIGVGVAEGKTAAGRR